MARRDRKGKISCIGTAFRDFVFLLSNFLTQGYWSYRRILPITGFNKLLSTNPTVLNSGSQTEAYIRTTQKTC